MCCSTIFTRINSGVNLICIISFLSGLFFSFLFKKNLTLIDILFNLKQLVNIERKMKRNQIKNFYYRKYLTLIDILYNFKQLMNIEMKMERNQIKNFYYRKYLTLFLNCFIFKINSPKICVEYNR